MPLNKLDNFIKNTEGRILYVNPSDLDSTDSITNEGNSLAQPFKTIQRALLEAARFSYLRGKDNDITEKTTILLFPGEHIVDNRPGYAIFEHNNSAKITPSNYSSWDSLDKASATSAQTALSLELDSIFDLTQEDNILYKFNSVYGGAIVPRGTSIVGLDLRKTKVRPKYVPNPTDPTVGGSSIFKITGACYFWQFSIFDGEDSGKVYTHPFQFGEDYQSTPRFSHNKLTCFEYADGVNVVNRTSFGSLTDLDMYYGKVGNAYNSYREIENSSKFPQSETSLAKRAPEWEIVGAFKSDPINISNIISGNGTSATEIITVTTEIDHGLNEGTPIRIRGVLESEYNVSTIVKDVTSDTTFTYELASIPINLNASPKFSLEQEGLTSRRTATVTVEVDTVSGASPYIFNISLRSVWGMQGMHANGSKADGFRSMVVAQFTAVSLQKDDRAFAKYNEVKRAYDVLPYETLYGASLPLKAASTNTEKVYHLSQDAVYRPGWESSHIKVSNNSFIQVVSVFAIGFTYHFDMNSGADASITNSNSNFGQVSLKSDGFRADAFDKDDHGYITSIVAPRSLDTSLTDEIEWLSLDAEKIATTPVNDRDPSKLWLRGFVIQSAKPTSLTQGYRIGAKDNDDIVYRHSDGLEYKAPIFMTGKVNQDQVDRNKKEYSVTSVQDENIYTIGAHNLKTGERVIIQSKSGDLPENIKEHTVYFAITSEVDSSLSASRIKLAASSNYAFLGESVPSFIPDDTYTANDLVITSRISDKDAGDIGSPIQWDDTEGQWYLNVGYNTSNNTSNEIYDLIVNTGFDANDPSKFPESTDLVFIKRISDERSLDEKTFKLRVVVPKEARNAKNPEIGFVLQDSSSTKALAETEDDIKLNIPGHVDSRITLPLSNTKYDRNLRYIASINRVSSVITVRSETPHNLKLNDIVVIRDVKDNTEASAGQFNRGYNGSFKVASVLNSLEFTYSTTDIGGFPHAPGVCTNNFDAKDVNELPSFERNDIQSNLYVYRNDVIEEYIEGERDGIYHLYVLNAANSAPGLFEDSKFTQTPVDLYPQLDRDNYDDNPLSAKTFAKRAPIGDVCTNDLKKSITRETVDTVLKVFDRGLDINSLTYTSSSASLNFAQPHGLGGVRDYDSLVTSSTNNHTNATHFNVKLYNENTLTNWQGATANVTVSGNEVTSVTIVNAGSGYGDENFSGRLYFDTDTTKGGIGGSADSYITVSSVGISSYIGDVLQLTGDGQTPDSYHRITSVGEKSIDISRGTGDPTPSADQYAFVVGKSTQINTTTFGTSTTIIDGETSVTVGIVTFTTIDEHGLNVGNKFRAINSSNVSAGDYIVEGITNAKEFRVRTASNLPISVDNGYILKHGISSNEGISDIRDENYAARTVQFYGGETFRLRSNFSAGTNDSALAVVCLTGNTPSKRLKLGDFLQVNNEIMRVNGPVVDTAGSQSIPVSRSYLGTRQENHKGSATEGDIVIKINPIPIEFRRPTICRASAHTFEYLGYGPGNYSTALPQVQVKTLSEREDFLVQAQERSGGAVIYTGMNSKGDTFNGNTKISAASGETVSYDIPKPTITGQDPSKLSVAFDEVTVRERILVEGGESGFVLSQFDGPVTMTKQLRVKKKATFNGQVRITFSQTADNENTGSLVVKGGIAAGDNTYIRGKLVVTGESQFNTGIVPDSDFGAYIGKNSQAFTKAYIGDVQIGAASSTTIDTRNEGLTISASGGNLTLKSATNDVVVTSTLGDIEVNAGSGKSITTNESTIIKGDLEVRGQGTNVPPGDRSGTIRGNYLEVPNVTPVGSVVMWAGRSDNLPTGTVNGSVVTMWNMCDGSDLNTYTYRALHKIISNTYGGSAYNAGITDDPSATTTFKLPNLENQFVIASNSDAGSNLETNADNVKVTKRSGGSKDSIVTTHDHPLSGSGVHDHSADATEITPSGQLSSSGTTDSAGQHTHGRTADQNVNTGTENANHGHPVGSGAVTTPGGGNHGHTLGSTNFVYNLKINTSRKFDKGRNPTKGVEATNFQTGQESISGGTHNHGLQFSLGAQSENHSHPFNLATHPGHQHPVGVTGADHTHPWAISDQGPHGHTVESVGETGRNKNLPPYFALYYIMRVL